MEQSRQIFHEFENQNPFGDTIIYYIKKLENKKIQIINNPNTNNFERLASCMAAVLQRYNPKSGRSTIWCADIKFPSLCCIYIDTLSPLSLSPVHARNQFINHIYKGEIAIWSLFVHLQSLITHLCKSKKAKAKKNVRALLPQIVFPVKFISPSFSSSLLVEGTHFHLDYQCNLISWNYVLIGLSDFFFSFSILFLQFVLEMYNF